VEEAERIRAFGRDLDDRLAERTVATEVGDALFVDALPDVYMLNYLRADRGDAATIAATGERVLEAFHHRKVFTYLDLDLGWDRMAHLVMLHGREPDRRVDTSHVRRVPFDEIAPLRLYDYANRELGEQLNEAQRRIARAVDTHWLAALDGDRVAAWCHVRSAGGVAQIEDVNTLPEHRGRGHGRAVVQHALDEAARTHDLVYLEALEDDWPRHLYAKLGFEEIDRCYHHVRPGHPAAALRIRTLRLELRLGTVAEWRELGTGSEPASAALARSTGESWHLILLAFAGGRPVGSLELESHEPGRVLTRSRLAPAHREYEAELRSAALSFAFDVLGARSVDGERRSEFHPLVPVDVTGFDPSWLTAK
jgi:ribosomal protein S18 acetylase RimI-like enzyme